MMGDQIIFRFLHISDVHFRFHCANSFENVTRKMIAEKIIRECLNKRINCLIISGDLFHQGILSDTDFNESEIFIKSLPGHENLVVVPGNHDLDRYARVKIDGYNTYLYREKVILQKAQEGEFTLSDEEKNLLYNESFSAFKQYVAKLCNKDYAPSDDEIQIQNFPLSGGLAVKIVPLNTSVLAGQRLRGEEFRRWLNEKKQVLENARNSFDTVKIAELELELTHIQRRMENDGGFIVDEYPRNHDGINSGRMSISKGTAAQLEQLTLDPTRDISIFVGHHSFDFMAPQMQAAFQKAVSKAGCGLYFCGHAHNTRTQKIMQNIHETAYEFQAGVMYKENWEKAQYGFNIGEIIIGPDGNGEVNITSFFTYKSPSGRTVWDTEKHAKIIPLSLNRSDATENINTTLITTKETKLEHTNTEIHDNTTASHFSLKEKVYPKTSFRPANFRNLE